ncbi:MAG: HEAT repeat domain-containing protein [Planctomycetaceae bacterium]|nr:HEAT repeat domain-containing protein [Planctomycetaceae bacterium]
MSLKRIDGRRSRPVRQRTTDACHCWLAQQCRTGLIVSGPLIDLRAAFMSALSFLMVAVMALMLTSSLPAQDIQPSFLMFTDPAFDVPPRVRQLPPGSVALWRKTLRRSEPELVQAAADCIAKAQTEGFPGMEECIDDLIAVLREPKLHRDVRYSVNRAIVEVDPSSATDLLLKASQSEDLPFKLLVEPALAGLNNPPAINVWVQRLKDPSTHRRELLLACQSLSTTKTEQAVEPLLAIAVDATRPADVRIAAGRAAGVIATSGSEDEAASLMNGSLVDALCAVSLLRQHTSEDAQQHLTKLAQREESVVMAPALRSLLDIDPELVLPFAESAVEHPDPKVRQCGLDAYVETVDEQQLPLIAAMLDDEHIEIRTSARQALFRLSSEGDDRDAVSELMKNHLNGDAWRAQEQAALFFAAADDKSVAPRFVELLDSARPEVFVTVAWGLRVLAAPETADGILDKVQRESVDRPSIPHGDRQLGHLFEACAVLGDKRVLPSIARLVPKDVRRPYSRSAGIWAGGKLMEGQPNEQIAAALMSRITDVDGEVPELEVVRRMSAVTLGRMKAESQLSQLRSLAGDEIHASDVSYAVGWAIEQITGERLPFAPPPTVTVEGWLIQPVLSVN